mmetsp:Transcript_26824/g.53969  ORF Transcript_26824/g.53969 Transcript_26824/m.53969 type:complete len:290 (+) Transcript_26824:467-1336(+)
MAPPAHGSHYLLITIDTTPRRRSYAATAAAAAAAFAVAASAAAAAVAAAPSAHSRCSSANSGFTVPPKSSTTMDVRTGKRSSRGVPFIRGSMASVPPSPMVPPTNTRTPGTAFIFPEASSSLRAGPPMSPMSAACTCPHELGQPVQWIRRARGTVTRASSSFIMASALFFVSISAKPQNCAPVQLTTLPTMCPGSTERRESPLRAGSARRAGRSSSLTLGRIAFCSTVKRHSPAEYRSARSASCRASSTESRPTGTCTPTRLSPCCGCACTPRRARRSKGVAGIGCATS